MSTKTYTGTITPKGKLFLHTVFEDGQIFDTRLSKKTFKQAFVARPNPERRLARLIELAEHYEKAAAEKNQHTDDNNRLAKHYRDEAAKESPVAVRNYSNAGKLDDLRGCYELVAAVNF